MKLTTLLAGATHLSLHAVVVSAEVAGRHPRIVGPASGAEVGHGLERAVLAVARVSSGGRRGAVRVRHVAAIVTGVPPCEERNTR